MFDKEKAKGKAQDYPFTSMLRADEDIVWESTPEKPGLWQIIKGNSWPYQIIFWIFACIACIELFTNVLSPGSDSLPAVGLAFSIQMGLILCVDTLRWLFQRYRLSGRFYAITNERVLYYIKGLKRSIPLKALPAVDVFPVDVIGSFRASYYYPMWLNSRDAKSVKKLMAQAQRQFSEEIS